MSARLLAAMLAALFAVTAVEASARPHNPFVKETPLQQAREEAGAVNPLQRTELLPAGQLRLSESELLASAQQTLGFTVTLDRDVESARLDVELPARWVARSGISELRYAKVPETGRRARRSGRAVSFTFDDGKAGDEATYSITDVGIPAGEYELPYRWTQPGGESARGSVKVRFYAPTREAQQTEPEWSRIASPGFEKNATNDAVTESETFITVVPGDRRRLVVGANGGGGYNAWITNDGGQSFVKASMPVATDAPGEAAPETSSLCCDPMSAADEAGNVWYGGLSVANGAANPSRIVINRFAPGETTFQPLTTGLPTVPERSTGTQDKPMMSIDNARSSPRYGRLYVVWNEPQTTGGIKVVMSQCDTRPGGALNAARCDNADNWSTPVPVTPTTGSYIYADVGTGPDGTVYVVWWDYSSLANGIRGEACGPTESCASAGTWGSVQTIATLDKTGDSPIPFACPIVAQPGGRASTAPGVDVDRSGGPNNGRVYVTWSDLRTGSGTTRCAGGQGPQATHLTFDNFVASAVDKLPGEASPSPSVATRLLTDGEGGGQANSDDWFTWLAVDQTTGQAWADFYSTRDDVTRRTTNFYVRSVTPSGGGHTLGALNKVSAAASDYSTAACCTFGNDYGDYSGIDATDGIAFPVWSDKRGGLDGEAFTFIKAEPLPRAGLPVIDDAAGDADGVLEPGERFALTQSLRNDGSAGATAVTATLDGGPDVTVDQGSSSYPDIAVTASQSNVTPYTGSVSAAVPCGARLAGTLQMNSAEGAYSVPISLPTGAAGPIQTFDATPGATIPDGNSAGVASEITLAGITGRLSDLDVRINVEHPYVGDLTARLEAPDGRKVTLVARAGSNGDNFANTVFDDEAPTAIGAGSAPFASSFRPVEPLSTLDGLNPNGTWKLVVVDAEAPDEGKLTSWGLSARGATCSTVPETPVLTGTEPASPSADTTPLVRGTAPVGASVRLYTGGACIGTPAATGTAAALASPGLEITVPGAATTQIRAQAVNGGFSSVCSPPLEYVQVTPKTAEPTPAASATATPTPPGRGASPDREVVLTLTAAATQRALKAKGLRLTVACPQEACTAAASGVLTIKRKKLKTGTAKKALAARQPGALTLELSKALTRKLKAALRSKKARVQATVTVLVTDAAGNTATKSVTVKLKR